MLLSIITINLNNRNGLEQTIKSVLSQTWKDFEYIVIDGNSSDGSKDYLRSLPSNVSWISEVDTGIYNAMNKGIMRATGEYCLFLNSGDTLVDKEVLERAFSNHFTDDIVCFGTYDHSSNGIFKKYPPKRISLFTFTGGSLPHPSTFIKKKLFETIGLYQENYRIISDWCFFIQALIKHQASYASFDEILSNFICDGVSSTSSYKELQTAHDFLEKQFPRIYDDYKNCQEEYIVNALIWLREHSSLKSILCLPFRILNHFLRLRNRLRMRQSVIRVK